MKIVIESLFVYGLAFAISGAVAILIKMLGFVLHRMETRGSSSPKSN